MRLLPTGDPAPPKTGDPLPIDNGHESRCPARVVKADFYTPVFRGDVSVRYDDGTLDLVDSQRIIRS